MPEHQAKSEELLLEFVTSLARKDAEQFASELFKIDNATHEKKLTAASARSDRKREKNSIKSVMTGTSVVTERENKARNGGRGGGTSGKGNNKKGWSRGRGRGDRGIQTRGRGCRGNNSLPDRFEQVVDADVTDIVLKEESRATTDRKDSAIGEPSDSGVQEGKGNQVVQEDGDKLALKMAIENSLNLYGEGSSSGVELSEERALLIAKIEETLEVEGEVKGKITNDSDEVEGEVILWKGRNFA